MKESLESGFNIMGSRRESIMDSHREPVSGISPTSEWDIMCGVQASRSYTVGELKAFRELAQTVPLSEAIVRKIITQLINLEESR